MKLEKKHLGNPQLVERVLRDVRLKKLLIDEPQLIARLYASAGAVGLCSRVGEVVKLLPDATLTTLMSEVMWGKDYGGVWPKLLFCSCDFDLLCRLTRLLPRVGRDTALQFSTAVISNSSPGLLQCIREATERHMEVVASGESVEPDERILLISDVLGDVLGHQLNRGIVVMPRATSGGPLHRDHVKISRQVGIPSLPELGNGGVVQDPKGTWQFNSGIDWVVPEDIVRPATWLVCCAVGAFRMPQDCRDLCHRIGENAQEVISQIKAVWSEVVAMTEEGGLETFRWLPAVGVNVEPTVCGKDGTWTGLKRIHIEPVADGFPALSLEIVLDVYSQHMMYKEVVEADGLLSGVDEPDSDTLPMQWGLNLLINRAVVCFMRYYVQSACSGAGSHSNTNGGSKKHEGGDVAMCFPRLPQKTRRDGKPYSATPEAVKRAVEFTGFEPPRGRTFRTSPPISAANGEYRPKVRTHQLEIGG